MEGRSQFSAKFDAFEVIGQPTSAAVVCVRDVLIWTTSDVDVPMEEVRAHPPIGMRFSGIAESRDPVELGRGLRLDRLSKEDAELVMNACNPRGHYFAPVRQYGQRMAFIRDFSVDEWRDAPFRWDPDDVIWDALSLSRLVRDNGQSTEYAARIADFEDGEQTVVYTLPSESKHAYRLRRDRDWLDPDEGRELGRLLDAYWESRDELPSRVRRAMWRAEYASWLKWADLALPILVGGLESLLKTERHQATHQFKNRVAALAQELDFDGIDGDFCERMYDARSEWVHGAHVRLFSTGLEAQQAADQGAQEGPRDAEQRHAMADIARVQDVLRRAVRRCVEDEAFRTIFADDDQIRSRWAT
jgi:hypothetical protein